jgi:O-antigen ligase
LLVAAEAVTFSRTGYIAFAVGLLLGVVRFVRPLQTLTGTLAFAVLVVVMGYLPSSVWLRAESIPTAILRGRDTMKVRYDLWRTGVAMMRERPLLGVGLENTRVAAPEYRPPGAGIKRLVLHNTYLDIGAEVGIPALVIFLFLLGSAWRDVRRSAHSFANHPHGENLRYLALCVEIGLIICMIQSISLSLGARKVVWMILAWCVTLARLALREKQPTS